MQTGLFKLLYFLLVTENLPTRLQCLDVPIIDDQDCENAYPGMITRRMLCAGYMDGGRDACNVSSTLTHVEEESL